MSLKLVTTEIVPVTKSLAKKFRDMTPVSNERPLKANRAKSHVKLIMNNTFFTPQWGCCTLDGVTYRGNGNHTSNVLAACMQAHDGGLDERATEFAGKYLFVRGGDWTGDKAEDLPEVKEGEYEACVETFTADSANDLVTFFERYDSADSVRSKSDVMGVYIGEQSELRDLSRDRCRYALAGVMAAAKRDPDAFRLPGDDLLRYRGTSSGKAFRVPQIRKAVRWIVETVPDANLYKNAVGAQVCAEVYATYGEGQGEKIVATMVQQIENDVDPAASFEAALNKRHNKPTVESLLKKGRFAVKEIAKTL